MQKIYLHIEVEELKNQVSAVLNNQWQGHMQCMLPLFMSINHTFSKYENTTIPTKGKLLCFSISKFEDRPFFQKKFWKLLVTVVS